MYIDYLIMRKLIRDILWANWYIFLILVGGLFLSFCGFLKRIFNQTSLTKKKEFEWTLTYLHPQPPPEEKKKKKRTVLFLWCQIILFRFHVFFFFVAEVYIVSISSFCGEKQFIIVHFSLWIPSCRQLTWLTVCKWSDTLKSSLFRLEPIQMMTKLRPFVHTFLKEASNLFEMYIYTMGERPYAIQMAKLLDPGDVYFNSRIIAQGDCTQRHQKGLDVVLGQESAVIILDDTEPVFEQLYFRNSWSCELCFNVVYD